MGKTYVVADVHGAYKALKQVLERSNFDYDNDTLIQLGDCVDGFSQTYEVIEELLKIKNLISIKGNHDEEFRHWIEYGLHKWNWLQGAAATAKSYIKHADREDILFMPKNGGYVTNLTTIDIPVSHQRFFEKQHLYYIDDKNRLFIHGGFNRHFPLSPQPSHIYYWDRGLWNEALSYESMSPASKNKNKFKMKDDFTEIFIGHTATTNWLNEEGTASTLPMKAANIWNLDTGCGWPNGKLTIMDVASHEFWQSDLLGDLYPDEQGRN